LSGSTQPRPHADAIVVAAGRSQRMGGIDKLGWVIGGRPLLAHTLDRLAAAPDVEAIVVVTAPDRRDALAAAPWLSSKVQAVVAGGERRQDSVQAGIDAMERLVPDAAGERVLLVHDGARPVISLELVAAVAAAAQRHGAAIPIVPVVETVKRLVGDQVAGTVDRSTLGVAQTPQGIRRSVWRAAAASPEAVGGTWTDEAALLEACRIDVHVVPGDPSNLKVTTPADLARAAASLSSVAPTTAAAPAVRFGIGHDSHPFGPGSPLHLGGIEIDGAPRLAGHSDGDVALHAIADALLGAAALGDLGRLFPATSATPAGIASRDLLATVVTQVADAGWRPAAIDLTIVAARPRLSGRLDAMRSAIAEVLGLDVGQVSVKASTGNLDGSEGAGRSISAIALASIESIA
jgi:2-C-methyl-D-erythritol 4-phosphate cytidylyltransferase/2-C-methyl-D-erythritol 2,4-cyclodiphosphate synthase